MLNLLDYDPIPSFNASGVRYASNRAMRDSEGGDGVTYLHAVVLGLVEGLTEFLPVSSTGHLILAARLLKIPPSEFLSSFEIAIQLGAILAVLFLYGKSHALRPAVLARVAVAFLPTAVVGAVFYELIKHVFLSSAGVVLGALFAGGIGLIVFEHFYRPEKASGHAVESIPFKHCFWIGVVQSLSVIPGVSRAAATVIGGLALGLNRKTIVEFSFLLAVPTMLAAAGFDLWKSRAAFSTPQWDLLAVGLVISFAVALLSIKFFLHFIQKHNFAIFGVYRIALAAILGLGF